MQFVLCSFLWFSYSKRFIYYSVIKSQTHIYSNMLILNLLCVTVMVNVICQFDRATECSGIWVTHYSACVCEGVLDEISI